MAKQEQKIDDLAALFLPDLLTPIGNYNVNPNSKTDENGFLFGIEQTTEQTTQPYPQLISHPYGIDANFRSSLGDLNQMGMRSFNNITMDLGHGSFYQHEGHSAVNPSYANPDNGHSFKETNTVSTSMPPPLRQRPNILPIQSYGQLLGQSFGNIVGQSFGQIVNQSFNNYDNILWLLQSESLQSQRPVNGQVENNSHNSQVYMLGNAQVPHPIELSDEINANARRKKALAPAIPDIHIDYTPNSLLHLLDMASVNSAELKKAEIYNSFGDPVAIEVKGFLHGRFCTNNLDNYIYRLGMSESIDETRLYAPVVISCYRRNFINIHLAVTASSNKNLIINGEPVKNIRIQIGATAQGPEAGVATFSIRDNENDPKDPTRAGDNLAVDTIGETHDLNLMDLNNENYFMVRKLKFDNSTVNTLKLSSQTYYCLTVSLIAELPSGAVEIERLISTPIIVRGRNPSFYNTRNDILIKPRSPYFRASYGSTESLPAVPVHKEMTLDAVQSGPDEHLIDETSDPFLSIKTEDLSDENASESEDNSPLDDTKSSEDLYIKQILDSMQNSEDSNYHYFPVLSVYYTPPVNVVYFPHGAHLSNTVAQAGSTPHELNSSKEGTSTRKKVYFK